MGRVDGGFEVEKMVFVRYGIGSGDRMVIGKGMAAWSKTSMERSLSVEPPVEDAWKERHICMIIDGETSQPYLDVDGFGFLEGFLLLE